MADYIYMMGSRLTPDQQRAVSAVEEIARTHEMNVYLSGGTIRDIISGFSIRDLDLTVQGNALKFQKDLEKAGALIQSTDEALRSEEHRSELQSPCNFVCRLLLAKNS